MVQHKIDEYKIDLNKYRIDTAIEDLITLIKKYCDDRIKDTTLN